MKKGIPPSKKQENKFTFERTLLEYRKVVARLAKGNDDIMVIVSRAYLDDLLKRILVDYLVGDPTTVKRLMRPDGPIGSFAGRIDLAYSLGMFSKTIQDDLNWCREIRNRFAHGYLGTSFTEAPTTDDETKIRSLCRKLKQVDLFLKHADARLWPEVSDRIRKFHYPFLLQ